MKRITLLFLFICTAWTNMFSQVDPCYVLTEVLREVDRAVVQGRYDDALRMLEKVKSGLKYRQCPEMKDGVVDFKMKDVKERINRQNNEQAQQGLTAVKVDFESDNLFVQRTSSLLTDRGKTSLKNLSQIILKQIEEFGQDKELSKVVLCLDIIGHIDTAGSEEINKKITSLQARAVADYLINECKISPKAIKNVDGMGSIMPKEENNTAEGRAANRRIELYLYARSKY